MFEINIYGTPPSSEVLKEMRDAVKMEDTAAYKVSVWTPIPAVDLLAGPTTHVVEEVFFGKDFRPKPGAMSRDWSESAITQAYVDQVSAQPRELVGIEVEALDRHLAFERKGKAAASVVLETASGKGKDAIHGAGKAAGRGFSGGLISFFEK